MNYEIKKLKKENIDLKHWEYEYQQRGEQPISLCDFFWRPTSQYLLSWLTGRTETYDYLFTDSSKGYNNPMQKPLILAELRKKLEDPDWVQYFLKTSGEFPKNFNAEADKVNEAIKDSSISNKKLAEYWEKMDAGFIKLVPWIWYPWYVSTENMLTGRVKQGLEKHRSEIEKIVDFDEALLIVVFSVKKTAFQLEQEDMLKLVLLAEKNAGFADAPLFKEEAEQYLKKYDWLTMFILTPLLPMSYVQLVERVKKALKENFKENLESQKRMTKKNEETAEKIIKIVTGDAQLILDIENARELGYALTAGIEGVYESSSRYCNFMQLAAKRIGVPFEDIKYLLSNEVFVALQNDETISGEIIQERKKGFAMMVSGGEFFMSVGAEGREISEWVDSELNKVDSTVSELRGQTACKGTALAKVKVVLNPAQAHDLTEGEILVCPMTNPDYVPAMRRASAIITDEGGLLSHAAIMSREFGKPCIIGTKIATKVLHDGDLVEVDTERGNVTILERALFK